MELISVIIPARKERYLSNTIEEVLTKLTGPKELIVVLEGNDEPRVDGVRYIYNKRSRGMRTAINQAAKIAKGDYLMKLDAHCMLDVGIDEKLKAAHDPLWVQIPTRKRLIAGTWSIDDSRPDVNHMYLNEDYMGIVNRTQDSEGDIIDTQVFQGSCYFLTKRLFVSMGGLDAENFGGSGYEAVEVATKVRRLGGSVKRNKTTWYAHARVGRRYVSDRTRSRSYIRKFMEEV